VRVQAHTDPASELGWTDAPGTDVVVTQFYEGGGIGQPDLALWVGAVTFAGAPPEGKYRLLIEEFEYITADYLEGRSAPGRLIYAETFTVDAGLLN
jgi:hypothetical protein